MPHRSRTERRQVRGQHTNTHFDEGLADVVRETTRLWRKYHLGYDQTKYVVEQARHHLSLAAAAHAPAHGGAAGES